MAGNHDKDIATAIETVRDEIATRLRRGVPVTLVVPHDVEGKPNFAAAVDEVINRVGIPSVIPENVDKGEVFLRVLGTGPQDGNAFLVEPQNRGRATAYKVLAV